MTTKERKRQQNLVRMELLRCKNLLLDASEAGWLARIRMTTLGSYRVEFLSPASDLLAGPIRNTPQQALYAGTDELEPMLKKY